MVYKLKKYDTFQITGRGIVFSLDRFENECENINKEDTVIGIDDKEYRIRGIEMFRNNIGIGRNIGLLVKEKI